MGVLTDYAEGKFLNLMLNATAWTPPASVYMALFTAAPSDSGGGTEVTGGSYARVQITAGFTYTAGAGLAKNTAAINWPTPTANWGTVTHWGLFDAASGGNLLAWGALQSSKLVQSGDAVRFQANAFQLSAD